MNVLYLQLLKDVDLFIPRASSMTLIPSPTLLLPDLPALHLHQIQQKP